ncbi:hypothetical protein DFH08DRAFT_941469 [Mycena albidolilacea]|uniref:Uncharacterized protein n=1 Tax=Mycena albidolilacea TaxID=1033008 RepID=A0AAD6ZIB9_9AGAR|nr:hypothetical protein DFH08DRAFT_941469 [Mycena albidolilacea]
MTSETTLLTDIAGKPAAVVRLGSDATRKTAAAPHGVASPSLESAPVLSDTREANTRRSPLANGTSSPPLNKNERNSRLKFGWQHIHWTFVIVTLLGLLIGVIVTGYLFSKSAQDTDHKDRRGQILNIPASTFFSEQAHNVSLEGTMSLSDFDPFNGNVSFSSGSSTSEARYLFCFYLLNDQTQSNVTSGFETDSPPGSSASQARLTSDPKGQSMRYPFDTYTSTVGIVAAYQLFFNNTILPPDACRNWLTARTAPDCSLTVQQSLAGWHAVSWLLSLAKRAAIRFGGYLRHLALRSPSITERTAWNSHHPNLARCDRIPLEPSHSRAKNKHTKETAKGDRVDPEGESLLDKRGENQLAVPKARIEKVLFCDVLEEFPISQ